MQLVSVILTVDIVALEGTIDQTKGTSSLLVDRHTGGRRIRAIVLSERFRIGESLNCAAKLLGRNEVHIDDVVGELLVRLGPRRRLGDGRQTVPRDAVNVGTRRVELVKDSVVDAGLIETIADIVPREDC